MSREEIPSPCDIVVRWHSFFPSFSPCPACLFAFRLRGSPSFPLRWVPFRPRHLSSSHLSTLLLSHHRPTHFLPLFVFLVSHETQMRGPCLSFPLVGASEVRFH